MCIYTEIQSSTCEIQAANTCTNTLTILLQEDEMCVCVWGGGIQIKMSIYKKYPYKINNPHTHPTENRSSYTKVNKN